jgi:hypothetical protein
LWINSNGIRSKLCENRGEGDGADHTDRLYDEFARLMNDAAGVAQGMRREN